MLQVPSLYFVVQCHQKCSTVFQYILLLESNKTLFNHINTLTTTFQPLLLNTASTKYHPLFKARCLFPFIDRFGSTSAFSLWFVIWCLQAEAARQPSVCSGWYFLVFVFTSYHQLLEACVHCHMLSTQSLVFKVNGNPFIYNILVMLFIFTEEFVVSTVTSPSGIKALLSKQWNIFNDVTVGMQH